MEKIKKFIKKITLDEVIKLSIVFAILLVGFSLFSYYVIFLPQKEKIKIEQQKQEQIAKELREQEAREQEKKEYIARRKKDCYDLYLQEKKQWNNVQGFDYNELRDVCIVRYKLSEPAKSSEECSKIFENSSEVKHVSLLYIDMIFQEYFDCLRNTFSIEF